MKNLILLAALAVGAIWFYGAFIAPPVVPVVQTDGKDADFPDWKDVPAGENPPAAQRGKEPRQIEIPPTRVDQSSSAPQTKSLSDWWLSQGGLNGIVGKQLGNIRSFIKKLIFGNGEDDETKVPLDLTKHFQKVVDATVTIHHSITALGVPQGGATGFIVSHKGRVYIATNIHVIEGFAEGEASRTWYEGPKSSDFGDRDARLARSRVPFHLFAISGHRQDPNYLGFMAQTELPVFKTRQGETLELEKQMLVSRLRDVVLIPVKTDIAPLQFSGSAPVDQENIFIVSNPEARGTVYLVRGSVKGIGPDRLELRLDGDGLIEGMSGSAVVSAKTGEVVGIVSYVYEWAEFNPEAVIQEATAERWGRIGTTRKRDFAYRLDNLNDFQAVSWSRFCREVGIIHALNERSRNVVYAMNMPVRNYDATQFMPHEIQEDFNGHVGALYNSMASSLRSLSETDGIDSVQSAIDAYRRRLEHALNADMFQLRDLLKEEPVQIPWFQRRIEESVARDQQIALRYIRAKSGQLPSGPRR